MRKQITGVVLSNKMDKTIVVGVETWIRHPLYNKRMRRMKKYFVHDAENKATEGDTILIEETRPMSKNKRWKLIEIMERSNL